MSFSRPLPGFKYPDIDDDSTICVSIQDGADLGARQRTRKRVVSIGDDQRFRDAVSLGQYLRDRFSHGRHQVATADHRFLDPGHRRFVPGPVWCGTHLFRPQLQRIVRQPRARQASRQVRRQEPIQSSSHVYVGPLVYGRRQNGQAEQQRVKVMGELQTPRG